MAEQLNQLLQDFLFEQFFIWALNYLVKQVKISVFLLPDYCRCRVLL